MPRWTPWWSPTGKKKAAGVFRGQDIHPNDVHNPVSTVGQVMVPYFIHATPGQQYSGYLTWWTRHNVSIVPILDEAETLCGLITKSSLMTTLSHQYLDTERQGGNE